MPESAMSAIREATGAVAVPPAGLWNEQLFDADGKWAGFSTAGIAEQICAKRPGWTHKPSPSGKPMHGSAAK